MTLYNILNRNFIKKYKFRKEKKEMLKEKEKPKKISEAEALTILNELQKKAMGYDGIYFKELRVVFKKISRILIQSKRIQRARSDVYSKKFKENELKPFFKELALNLSELAAECRGSIGTDAYLDLRGDVADFLVQEGPFGECMGTHYQLDFLFESRPKIVQENLGLPSDYKSIIIVLIAILKMFNSMAVAL